MKALLLLAVSAALAAQTPIEAKTILVIGDSISAGYGIQRDQGWVALLESRVAALHPPHKVVNASISGDTTGGALARLPRTLEVHKPDVVIIELGGNDALRGYPVERIENNLDAMAGLAKDAGASVVVLGMEIPPNYGARYTQAFHAIYADVAKRTGAALVPFLLDGVATDDALMQADGIHPTAAAQARLLDNVWPALKSLL
ncbi:MAG TPA: arylesterase [Pseudomonadales bacterium]|jgi:acyl-CoA thioesterase-1|nr:arylesterase [Pseudomonadales bacterium]